MISPPEEDYYAILGCSEANSEEQIKAEYRRAVLIHHPDKAGGHATDGANSSGGGTVSSTSNNSSSTSTSTRGGGSAGVSFAVLHEAYETLSDAQQRRLYDTWRKLRASGFASPQQSFAVFRAAHTDPLVFHWHSDSPTLRLDAPTGDGSAAGDAAAAEPAAALASATSAAPGPAAATTVAAWQSEPAAEGSALWKFRNYHV